MLVKDTRLQEDYDRWAKEIQNDPFAGVKTIGVFDVLRAHYLIVDYFLEAGGEGIGGVGPRDINLLFSALGRQTASFGATIKWTEELDICATLFFGLIKNHAFHDANKRTAFLTLLFHLWKIDRVPEATHGEFETLALRVASNTLPSYRDYAKFQNKEDAEVHFISKFLRKTTRKMDRKLYFITYHELNRILARFNFWLANPSNNKIEIWHAEEATEWKFLIPKKKMVERRIGVIDFPGWSRQMARNDLRDVRRLTRLTDENGCDGDVFFRDATPLEAYIEQYKSLLERLADR